MEKRSFKPHPYQERAIRWILDKPHCALFLDMGLGKTVVTLTAIQSLIDSCEIDRALVIAPKKVAESTWTMEADKWAHLSLRVVYVGGTAEERRKVLQTAADIHVVSRDNVAWMMNELKGKFPFDMVAIDELSSFKNPRSIRFKSLKTVLPSVKRVVGMTGTPAPNGMLDLWAQVYCIDAGERLGRFFTHYRSQYFNTVEHNHIVIKCTPKKGAPEEIMSLIEDICLVMRASDYLDLPDLIEQDYPVILPAKIQNGYKIFERERVMELKAQTKGAQVTASSAASLINKLAQYANGAIYDDERTVIPIHEEKLAALEEILEGAGGPVLCFYQYIHDRDRIVEKFSKSMKTRCYHDAKDLEDWNAGKIDLLLAHPASTAFGLNMQQGGSVIVWYSTGWNLELYQQANARLYRQGQQQTVRVFRIVSLGSVDERMTAALAGKSQTQAGCVRMLAEKTMRLYKT